MSLFSPFTLAGITFPNRIAVSPMSQYRAIDGFANDWHVVHLGRFAMGGAGLVYLEATAVEERGRRTPGDLGIWDDAHIPELRRITSFLEAEGAVPGIQLGHAGRKASERRPWHGETPVTEEDINLRGEAPWTPIAPSALPYGEQWSEPTEMTAKDIKDVLNAFRDAAHRSLEAGFKTIEVYAAHGFLIHQFYSPAANQRTDAYGGDFDGRIRFALEVADAIRSVWPENLPLIFRLSVTDWLDDGWQVEDSIELARRLKTRGVDMIDCSSGAIGGSQKPQRMPVGHGFQVPFAARIRQEADIATMGVGFIWDAQEADNMITTGQVDMVALARELLDDPNWPLHAAQSIGADQGREMWKDEFGWWLSRRDRLCEKLKLR